MSARAEYEWVLWVWKGQGRRVPQEASKSLSQSLQRLVCGFQSQTILVDISQNLILFFRLISQNIDIWEQPATWKGKCSRSQRYFSFPFFIFSFLNFCFLISSSYLSLFISLFFPASFLYHHDHLRCIWLICAICGLLLTHVCLFAQIVIIFDLFSLSIVYLYVYFDILWWRLDMQRCI